MSGNCQQYRDGIARELFQDLDPADQLALRGHLEDCPSCAAHRQALELALHRLQSLEDVPVPCHFYVGERARPSHLWALVKDLSLPWKGAFASLALGLLVLVGLAVSNFQFRAREGTWTVSFGQLPPPVPPTPEIDIEGVKAEILEAVQQRLKEANSVWFEKVREEIAQAGSSLEEKEGRRLAAALREVEIRVSRDLDQRAGALQDEFQRSVEGVYQVWARERRKDLTLLNERIDLLAVKGDIHSDQTDTLVATLIQWADWQLQER
ncbi:MAG: anti-sigma factor family protein [Acidobacteriota bacterium]